jgi:hypothetical protein
LEEALKRLTLPPLLKKASGNSPESMLSSRLMFTNFMSFENNSDGIVPVKLFEFK